MINLTWPWWYFC